MPKDPVSKRVLYQVIRYFSLAALMTALIGAFFAGHTINTSKTQTQDKIRTNLKFSVSMIDAQLWDIQTIGLSTFGNHTLKKVLANYREDIPLTSSEYFEIKTQLSLINNMLSGKISNLIFYFDDEVVYLANDGSKTEQTVYFDDVHRYDLYGVDYWQNLLTNSNVATFLNVAQVNDWNKNSRNIIPLVLTNNIGGSKAVLVADIPVLSLFKVLWNNAYIPTECFSVYNEKGNLLYGEPVEDLSSLEVETWKNVKIEGEHYVQILTLSPIYGWKYVATVPIMGLMSNSMNLIWSILAMCFIAIMGAVLIALYSSRRIYEPLHYLVQLVDTERFGKKNVLATLTNEIDRMIAARGMEQETVEQFARNYLDYSFQSLLHGERVIQPELFFEQLRKRIDFQAGEYVCCAIRVKYNDREKENELIWNETNEITDFFSTWPSAYISEQSERSYFLFWGLKPETDMDVLINTLKKLEEKVLKGNVETLHIGVGLPKKELSELSMSYAEAISALETERTEKNFWISRADLKIDMHDDVPDWGVESIIHAIEESRIQDALILMDSLYSVFDGVERTVLTRLVKRLSEIGVNPNVLNIPNENVDRREMERIMRQSAQIIQQLQQKKNTDDLVPRAIDLIHRCLKDDLSIEAIADRLEVSPRVLSQRFRAEKKISLPDYVMQARIDYVKGALVYTEKKISDIANEAGLYSRTTFIRAFKQLVGVTPTEYRAAHIQTKEAEDE